MSEKIYICDTCALFNFYRNFSLQFKNKIKILVRGDVLKISEGVWREIKRKTKKIFKIMSKIVEKYPSVIVEVKSHPKIKDFLYEIERKYGNIIQVGNQQYPGIWKSFSGRKAAEGQVIAIAKFFGYTVVSDDTAVKLVCMLENIECIGWTEFVRRLKIPQQQTLF